MGIDWTSSNESSVFVRNIVIVLAIILFLLLFRFLIKNKKDIDKVFLYIMNILLTILCIVSVIKIEPFYGISGIIGVLISCLLLYFFTMLNRNLFKNDMKSEFDNNNLFEDSLFFERYKKRIGSKNLEEVCCSLIFQSLILEIAFKNKYSLKHMRETDAGFLADRVTINKLFALENYNGKIIDFSMLNTREEKNKKILSWIKEFQELIKEPVFLAPDREERDYAVSDKFITFIVNKITIFDDFTFR